MSEEDAKREERAAQSQAAARERRAARKAELYVACRRALSAWVCSATARGNASSLLPYTLAGR